jgi:hypothetical protein
LEPKIIIEINIMKKSSPPPIPNMVLNFIYCAKLQRKKEPLPKFEILTKV